jgi:hypothetical protein
VALDGQDPDFLWTTHMNNNTVPCSFDETELEKIMKVDRMTGEIAHVVFAPYPEFISASHNKFVFFYSKKGIIAGKLNLFNFTT